MPEPNDEGVLTYLTPREYPESVVGRVSATTDYGYDFKLQNYDYTLRVMKDGEVFTTDDLIGDNARLFLR